MTVTALDQADILTRVFRPEVADMSEDAARSILQFTFSEDDRKRMDTLAAKARDGSLSSDEVIELDNYERVNNLLGIMKTKARRCLITLSPDSN